jgi:hypothetical protein
METESRSIEIIFIREFKSFTSKLGKKQKDDYILNVSKIIKDKFNSKFIVPNKVQSFLINYEIKKFLDKAINIKNEKYTRIIYLNSNLSISSVKNAMAFISDEYHPISFKYSMIEPKEADGFNAEVIEDLNIIKSN